MRLVLFGAPGSGKGTQLKDLIEMYKVRKISLGDILREEVKKGSALGAQVKKYMDQGVLVPDEIVAKAIEDTVGDEGFIMDGYPRNLQQAQHLDAVLQRKGRVLDLVVYLEIDKETAHKRLGMRRICKNCKAVYHLVNMPPKKEGICDACGHKLIQRNDDKGDVISQRWEVFLNESKPLLEYYREQGKLVSLDARRERTIVLEELKELIANGKYSQL